MKNLLKQIMKEDFFAILPWLFIPLIGVFAGLSLSHFTRLEGFNIITVIAVTILMAGPLIALVILVGNDHNRFYGKYAALYSSYPISSNKITLTRFINYIILGIFTSLSYLFNISLALPSDFDLVDFFREFGRLLGELSPGQYLDILKVLLAFLGFGLILSLTLMAANSIGNSYYFKKLGKLGPVVVGVILFALESFIQIRMLARFAVDKTVVQNPDMTLSFFEPNYIFIGVFIIELIAIYFATNYFHKKKLSVE
ncbi:Uncharacterised protein [Anaerococcus prevotii]|uniref:ABC transporter, permease protein n=1 Tax=Anaerococcus prevotii (strain ATCC 9321 / DSM 20548 / JCM 6508 / NCTC 11806 / PC1) TaxID=525919 RepID=C7RFG2_ANAPD|nr:hypothetical protein [Anaerococcus prevotii]ACV28223.1 hypothetical protein Apre_0171 [Anaerococcus prevotii DSM 20548]SUU93777.1 Uncharacterised protein [Anaerococcus prevotii]